jgi:DNA polymerase alpha subunit B
VPNPATFLVGGVVFGCTSTDVLFQLNSDETNRVPGSGIRAEKLPRMAQHLLEQRSYYPLFPATNPVETPLELSQLWHVGMPVSPDVLLLPSRLKTFIKPVSDTLVINPGTLCRASSGGTYAKLSIMPATVGTLKPGKCFADRPHQEQFIRRIRSPPVLAVTSARSSATTSEQDVYVTSRVSDRASVTILRI